VTSTPRSQHPRGEHGVHIASTATAEANRESIDAFAKARGLPLAAVGTRGALPASGLFAYGTNLEEYAPVTAKYVDRILKGAKPRDLPIEQPTRFSLVINLRAARWLGLTTRHSMLLVADEVIQ
jgi:putative ABC transport system substrate-binding protein